MTDRKSLALLAKLQFLEQLLGDRAVCVKISGSVRMH